MAATGTVRYKRDVSLKAFMMKNPWIVYPAFLIFLFVGGCDSGSTLRNAVIGSEVKENGAMGDIAEFVSPEQLLAYIIDDDPFIYVAEGYEEEVAAALEAKIEENTWLLKEENFARKRKRKKLKWEDWYPRVAVIKWTYMRGFKCIEQPAGTWINITNKRNRFLRSYKTTQKDWWCMRQRGHSCKIVLKEVTGAFWTRPDGRGRKKIETRKLSACSP